MLQRAGPVLAAVCLAVVWALAKPAPASARSQLARPLAVSSSQRSIGGVNQEQGALGGATSHRNQGPRSAAASSGYVSKASNLESNNLSQSASIPQKLASLSAAAPPNSPPSDVPPSRQDRSRFTNEVGDSQPSTSGAHEPSLPHSFHAAPSFRRTNPNPLENFLRNTGPPGGASSSNPLGGGGGDGANDKKPKGVQARERLDVYYLPEQIPRPVTGDWVSDQGDFLTPDWVTPRINQIVTGLKKDTGTEIVVVAINGLGKHAGIPDMLGANGGGGIEMDVPYKRQLAVKVLPGLEKKLNKWGDKKSNESAREAVEELRESVMAKMAGGNCTVGEVILEGVASVAEKVWVGEGKTIPPNMRRDPATIAARTNIEWVTVALTVFLVWSWADKSSRLSGWFKEVSAWSSGAFDRGTKRPGPACSACGHYTVLRGLATPDELKDEGVKKETELGSMGYYAYVCENLDCTGDNEARTNLVGWPVPFRAKRCPGCGYRTVRQTTEPLRGKGLLSDGVVKRVVECQHCGVKGERVMRNPSLVRGLRFWEKQMIDVTEDGRPKIAEGNGASGQLAES
ncbi:hypothetical protein KFL_006050060 [Klebsormidium nitens]|uniref:Uncharacterized protein n=1 Tax=Klebsormidium nitens TaxID=105231 RepID=A0A1Y1IGY9_KLENI|nr:hypothetical protein KFL_006050060 [Klebsormidium nitens]|eukprot:GAQ90144.1 hypothetical protein KFL_006050060 [Klebsormidium nitens]